MIYSFLNDRAFIYMDSAPKSRVEDFKWDALSWLRHRNLPQTYEELDKFMMHGREVDAFFAELCGTYDRVEVHEVKRKIICLEKDEEEPPRPSKVFNPQNEDDPSVNRCTECGIDMGPHNPRQLCGKSYCQNEYFQLFHQGK